MEGGDTCLSKVQASEQKGGKQQKTEHNALDMQAGLVSVCSHQTREVQQEIVPIGTTLDLVLEVEVHLHMQVDLELEFRLRAQAYRFVQFRPACMPRFSCTWAVVRPFLAV